MATMKLLLFLALIFVIDIRSADGYKCARTTAALEEKDFIQLFFGRQVNTFAKSNLTEIRRQSVSLAYLLPKPRVSVTAAYHPGGDFTKTNIISGNKFYRVQQGQDSTGPHDLSEIFPNHKYFASGVDAATSFGGKDFFFKECYILIKQPNGSFRRYNLKRMGIKCRLDSAWTTPKYMALAKGGVSWRIYSMKQKPKKVCFSNNFKTNANLCKCEDA